jgi:general secretion pathway protein J
MNASHPSCDKVAGFTLIEALIAMALMGTIVAALATIAGQWLPNWDRGLLRLQQSERLALGLERIVEDLAAAEFIPAGRQTMRPWFEGDKDAVTFVRSMLGPNAGPGLELVRIAEVSSERGPILVRMQAPFVPVTLGVNDRDHPRFVEPVVLQRPPYRLGFSYAGPDRIWRDDWKDQPLLPRAVKLTVRQSGAPQILALSTATLLHAELPAQCVTAKSVVDCMQKLLRPPASANAGRSSSERPATQ